MSSSYSFWTSSSLDVPAGVTQEEGHTGFLIHLLSAVTTDKSAGRLVGVLNPSVLVLLLFQEDSSVASTTRLLWTLKLLGVAA